MKSPFGPVRRSLPQTGMPNRRGSRTPVGVGRLPLRQGAWALADQVLSSGTNFALTLIMARLLAPQAFGSFALATATWITLMGLNRAVLIQPFVIHAAGDALPAWRARARTASGAVLVVGACAGVAIGLTGVVLGPASATGQVFVILGALAPFLVVQDFWRFAAFSRNRARAATANDALWAAVQAVCLVVIVRPHPTPGAAMVAWGAGAAAGAALGMAQFRLTPVVSGATLRWARTTGRLGGWFGLANCLYAGSTQLVSIVVAAGSGTAGLGGLRAMQALLGPAQLVAQSGDSVALPAASRECASFGKRGLTTFARRYGLLLTSILGAYGAILVTGDHSIVRVVLGRPFVRYASLVLPLAIGLVATSWSLSGSVALRAARKGQLLVKGEALGALARIALVVSLLHFYGVEGAAWGVALGSLLAAGAMWWLYMRGYKLPVKDGTESARYPVEELQPQ